MSCPLLRLVPQRVVIALALALSSQTSRAQDMPERQVAFVHGSNTSKVTFKIEGIDGEIMSPRDPQSGQATGKRTYKLLLASTSPSVIDEFPVAVADPLTVKTQVTLTLSAPDGGRCKVRTQAAFDANAKRFAIAIGAAARFFDAANRPRPNLCAP